MLYIENKALVPGAIYNQTQIGDAKVVQVVQ
jgi:hypothetical protein